jgi:hypothetical protein
MNQNFISTVLYRPIKYLAVMDQLKIGNAGSNTSQGTDIPMLLYATFCVGDPLFQN